MNIEKERLADLAGYIFIYQKNSQPLDELNKKENKEVDELKKKVDQLLE